MAPTEQTAATERTAATEPAAGERHARWAREALAEPVTHAAAEMTLPATEHVPVAAVHRTVVEPARHSRELAVVAGIEGAVPVLAGQRAHLAHVAVAERARCAVTGHVLERARTASALVVGERGSEVAVLVRWRLFCQMRELHQRHGLRRTVQLQRGGRVEAVGIVFVERLVGERRV